MKKILTLIVIFSSFIISAQDIIIRDTTSKFNNRKVTTVSKTLLWNSVAVGLNDHIYCRWEKDSKHSAILTYCFKQETQLSGFFSDVTRVLGDKKTHYTLISRMPISYNSISCTLKMDGEIIGEYYEGKCGITHFDKGIKITNAQVTINEQNLEITVD